MIAVLRLSPLLLAGKRYWLLPLLPLLWPAFQVLLLLAGARESLEPVDAQDRLIGVPVAVLAIFLGGRIIVGELDQRSLEIAYTVPGGAHRVWLGKLGAAALLLAASMLLMAGVAFAFLTPYPPLVTLYGAAQGVAFYLVAAMGLATLTRSEVAGALASVGVLGLNLLITGFGSVAPRVSPFWNPLTLDDVDPERMLALSLQNRIGVWLAIAAITALAFARAERRERMLAG